MPKDDYIDKFKQALTIANVSVGSKARRIIDLLEDIFARTWICARHLALMVQCFGQLGYFKQTKYFGTYRIDLIISLFARVIDWHNFEVVVRIPIVCSALHIYIFFIFVLISLFRWSCCLLMKWPACIIVWVG